VATGTMVTANHRPCLWLRLPKILRGSMIPSVEIESVCRHSDVVIYARVEGEETRAVEGKII